MRPHAGRLPAARRFRSVLPFLTAFLLVTASEKAGAQSIVFQFDGAEAGSYCGFAVAGTGDANVDGVPDLIVGSPLSGPSQAGRVQVFSGSDGSLLYTLSGTAFDALGFSVADAGDADGDGVGDIVAGAPWAVPGGNANAGQARVYSGATGLLLFAFDGIGSGPSSSHLGFSVTGVGDVNGDGYADVAAGGPYAEPSGSRCCDAGQVRVVAGPTGGPLYTVNGTLGGGRLGYSARGVGDLDGDGFPDVVAGGTQAMECGPWVGGPGHVRVFPGGGGSNLFSAVGANALDLFGFSVAGVGDWNGDAVPEIAVGAPRYDPPGLQDAGRVYVLSGANGAVLLTLDGTGPSDWFGYSVAGVEDVNGDSVPDLLVGAPQATAFAALFPVPASGCTPGWTTGGTGYARLFSGATGETLLTLTGAGGGDGFGTSVAGAGDLDGDGLSELFVGAPMADPGGNADAGRATVFSVASIFPTPFGSGCAGAGGFVPQISASGIPHLGNASFRIDLSKALGNSFAILLLGASNTGWTSLSIPLPWNLGLLGMPSCDLLVSGDFFFPAVTTGSGPGGGSAHVALPVPGDPALLGTTLYAQWWTSLAGLALVPGALSQGLALTFAL